MHIKPISLLVFSLTSPSDLKVPILARLPRGTKLKLFFVFLFLDLNNQLSH